MGITDGRYTYYRAPATPENEPLYHYGLMPTRFHGMINPEFFQHAEWGPFLAWTGTNCWRIPGSLGFRRLLGQAFDPEDERCHTALFDLEADPAQAEDLVGTEPEGRMKTLLVEAMQAHDSPPEQFERLGLN